MNRLRDQQRQQNLYNTEKMINKQEIPQEEKKSYEPIPVKHSEVVMNAQEPPQAVAPQAPAAKQEKKKKPVEQDASVFLTGMVDDQEMEEDDDEDV